MPPTRISSSPPPSGPPLPPSDEPTTTAPLLPSQTQDLTPLPIAQHQDIRSRMLGTILMLLFFSSSPNTYSYNPSSSSGFRSVREQVEAHNARERHNLGVLGGSAWGSFEPAKGRWLNLTGFEERDRYAWEGLAPVKERAEGERRRVLGSGSIEGDGEVGFYHNVTGVMHGSWVRSGEERKDLVGSGVERMNLSAITPDMHWGFGVWNRNITGREGQLSMMIEEKDLWIVDKSPESLQQNRTLEESPREVSATMTVQDESNIGDGWEMRLHGIHWPPKGALVMTTTSAKFAGIFGLPHLMTTKDDFESSQKMLNKTLETALKKTSGFSDLNNPLPSDDFMAPHCEYVVYAQAQRVNKGQFTSLLMNDVSSALRRIEDELRFPNGAPVPKPPPLSMSLIIFSPDCGFMLESKGPPAFSPDEGQHLQGAKQEMFLQRVRRWSLVWGFALFGQVLLLRTQMKEASAPSTLSRVSVYTIGMMVVADMLLAMCLMVLAASAPAVFPSATLAGLAVFLSVGISFRFLADIFNVQEPQRRERERERERAVQAAQSSAIPPAAAPIITAAGADSLPLPVTAQRPVSNNDTPIIIPSDQDIDAEIAEVANAASAMPRNTLTQTPFTEVPRNSADRATFYGRYMLGFLAFFFLTISSASWPTALRSFYVNVLSIIYLSLWTPQIYRNVMRNCRKALLWKFVVGQSMIRAAPFAYFYLNEDNVIFAERSGFTMFVLAGWLWVQVWILVGQAVLGPRFGLPKGRLPEAWDYHPILREDDAEGGGMPIGLVQVPVSPGLERVKTGEEGRKKTDALTIPVDCIICMEVIDVPVVPAGQDATSGLGGGAGGVVGMLARRQYMVTPCRHIFHSVCLESWMRLRLQCVICRETLPPL